MKKFVVAVFLMTLSALAANAQCEPEAETALYNKFLVQYKGTDADRNAARLTGKEYLSQFGECPTVAEKKITSFIKRWIKDYEIGLERACTGAVDNTPARAFELCGPYLALNPENLRAHLLMSAAGVKIAKTADKNLKNETVKSTRKALALIGAGKSVDQWVLGTRDETVATLEFFSASLTIDATPAETAATMLRLAQSNSAWSKDPNTYLFLARGLNESEARKLIDAYNLKCSDKAETPECATAYARVEATIDRVIDAYARAIAHTYGRPEFANVAADARPALVDLYRKRHENYTEADLNKYVAGVLAKAIPR